MRYIIIGLGSMGKKRIRCLLANNINVDEIIGFDLRDDRRNEARNKYGIEVVNDLKKVNLKEIRAMIISVPPDKHMQYAHLAVDNNLPCFIEASVVDDDMKEMMVKEKKKKIVIAPSCTMRYHPAIKIIKQIIDKGQIGKLSNFSYHCGQYLPDWHTYEAITDFYVSKKSTGAGREIVPFELTWMNWIFGRVISISGFYDKTIDLGCDIDDVYGAVIEYPNKVVGTLLVDAVSRFATRNLIINGDEGQIRWNWEQKKVLLYRAKIGKWKAIIEPARITVKGYNKNINEKLYYEEMAAFLDAINGRAKFPNTLKDDYQTLQVLKTLEKTAKKMKNNA